MTLYTIEVQGTKLASNIPESKVPGMVGAYLEANHPDPVTITAIPQEGS